MDQQLKHPSISSPEETKRSSRGKVILTTFIILLLLAGIVWWTRQQSAPQQAGAGRNGAPMSIVPETVGKGDIGINLNALGTVTSLATVTIKSQISGYLQNIDFKEGDEVKKGDLIAEIDPRPYQATLAQAKGQLARDEAQLKGAQVDLTRYQNLAAQNAVPHQQLDTQIALVGQYQGTVEADRASVQSAEVNLQYCHIVSPINGRVGLRQVDLGNYVTAGDATGLVVITQLEPISVLFTLPEDNLQAVAKRLREGAVLPTAAYDRSGTNKLASGLLQTFDSQIDQTTGTIKLRAQFDNQPRTLYPNQFVNIRLLLDTHKDVTTMSTAGIQRGVPGTFVYLVNADSTVSVRPVKLGVTDGDRVEVISGLSPGDRIVIDGADKLREGAKVVVRNPADAANPAAAAKGASSAAAKEGAADSKAGGGKRKRSEDGQKQ
ncbi:MdtA/MuxA family multidrug efflux RND transporter periplasmic adaptor subunit [Bradyrhizobium jicamae]|uniref:MdtA/MuxA family multidrug efflux RND transporter periplasmic adaptor subunit n=1 Tax=Bradyrhizobium jicamae TaxID=280332 RepID=UPI001BA7B1AA|nr:MdtA/MuxA family multidrug efflux RND transporter periplasmic adaptor subunit [Bradyrhizobium jicamae]MBR0937515.1 MdtA/MuxA family multidrug efflux RND transporter periplasmic adaptor subunit [Bradyrhizobium jicamae]